MQLADYYRQDEHLIVEAVSQFVIDFLVSWNFRTCSLQRDSDQTTPSGEEKADHGNHAHYAT